MDEGVLGSVRHLLSAHLEESQSQAPPSPVQTICLLLLAAVGLVWVLLKLSGVLVPLTFAIFLAFLVEPVLAWLVLLPQNACALSRKASRRCKARDPDPITPGDPGSVSWHSEDTERGETDEEEAVVGARKPCLDRLSEWLQGAWGILAIILCVALLFGVAYGIIAGIVEAISDFDWSRYARSHKLQEIRDLLAQFGVHFDDMLSGAFIQQYKGEVMDVALEVLGVLESVLLTFLLFFFVLLAMLPGIRSRAPRSRVKRLMQRYLLCKTIASAIIAVAVMLTLWLMQVELVLIFGIITFALNYIPNIGSFFAILAPVPLVALQPDTDTWDVVMVALLPFVVHNTLGNIIEPKLMAHSLDLHPLTVVVALTFWGSMWGVAGAVLSVPITCACRLWLEDVDHPYARTLHKLFDEPMGSGEALGLGGKGKDFGSHRTTSSLTASTASMGGSASEPHSEGDAADAAEEGRARP